MTRFDWRKMKKIKTITARSQKLHSVVASEFFEFCVDLKNRRPLQNLRKNGKIENKIVEFKNCNPPKIGNQRLHPDWNFALRSTARSKLAVDLKLKGNRGYGKNSKKIPKIKTNSQFIRRQNFAENRESNPSPGPKFWSKDNELIENMRRPEKCGYWRCVENQNKITKRRPKLQIHSSPETGNPWTDHSCGPKFCAEHNKKVKTVRRPMNQRLIQDDEKIKNLPKLHNCCALQFKTPAMFHRSNILGNNIAMSKMCWAHLCHEMALLASRFQFSTLSITATLEVAMLLSKTVSNLVCWYSTRTY